jgi:hypothetical protein
MTIEIMTTEITIKIIIHDTTENCIGSQSPQRNVVLEKNIHYNNTLPLLRKNDPSHAGCLPPRKKATDRQTDRHDGLISSSSLTLERDK